MSIFSHVTLGVSDLDASRTFWDKTLAPLGYSRLFDIDDRSGYGAEAPQFLIIKPLNGEAATAGNGATIALLAPSRKAVDEFHGNALGNGGSDEGAPGLRPVAPNFYAAYIRDPDGNKVAAISFTPE